MPEPARAVPERVGREGQEIETMSAAQIERMQSASSPRGRARGSGYLDGLYGVENRRLGQHPDCRFAYDAGYRDGAGSRDNILAGR